MILLLLWNSMVVGAIALVLASVGGLTCGFRSELILFILTFICVFYWEGLFQARYVLLLLVGMLLVGGSVLPFGAAAPGGPR